MRVLRAKQVRKFLKFYKIVFGILPPYHILLDGNFIFTAMKFKLDIQSRLESLLQESTLKLYVLKSSIDELKAVGEKASTALSWAQSCCEILDDSNHEGSNAHLKLVKFLESKDKKRHYFVASQDNDLRSALAKIPGVPTIYLNKVTLVLEAPSSASKNYSSEIEDLKMGLGTQESSLLTLLSDKKKDPEAIEAEEVKVPPVVRLKRKATAPNPLSNLAPKDDSQKSKKKKLSKYKA